MNQHETKQTGAALRLFVYMILLAALLLPASATTAQAAPVQQVSAAAVGTTYTVTSTSCTGPGSITEAMASANANSGIDTITFTPGLQIDAGQCLPSYSGPEENYFMLQATESVIFEGNGARLAGHIQWITTGGLDTHYPNSEPLLLSHKPRR